MTTIIILVLVVLLGIIFMRKSTYSPKFGVGGDGWYNASPNGLSPTTPRIRMQFAMDTKVVSSQTYTLFSLSRNLPGSFMYNLSVNKNTSRLYVTRYNGSTSKEFTIDTTLPLNDGKWHSVDVSISTVNNTIDIVVDGKTIPRITDSENESGEIKPFSVCIGGFVDGNSFQGKIKDVWFGNVQKTDISYQYVRARGENGGSIS